MSDPETSAPAPKPKGTPLGVAMFGLLGLTIVVMVGLGFLVYSMRGENRKLAEQLREQKAAEQRAELERQKAAEAEKLTVAANRQAELLAQVRSATNLLERLRLAVGRVSDEARALQSNDDGRRVALHPRLVLQARAFYEMQLPELPALPDVVTRIEATRRTEQQLIGAAGTTFQPEADLIATTQTTIQWAQDGLARTDRIATHLASLVRESKVKFTSSSLTATSPTLEAAMKQLVETESAAARATLAEETTKAKQEADQSKAAAEAEQIRAKAEAEAASIVAKAKADAELQKAAVEREIAMKKAERVKADTETKVAAETVVDEARKLELRKKAEDPAIQAKLKPFTTPGYWQVDKMSLDLKPHSFTKLKSRGALENNTKGATDLVRILTDKDDKVRPRWRMLPSQFLRHPDQIEQVKEVQVLLNELGPTLVEMKMLEP